jgi:hypothetical protein
VHDRPLNTLQAFYQLAGTRGVSEVTPSERRIFIANRMAHKTHVYIGVNAPHLMRLDLPIGHGEFIDVLGACVVRPEWRLGLCE